MSFHNLAESRGTYTLHNNFTIMELLWKLPIWCYSTTAEADLAKIVLKNI